MDKTKILIPRQAKIFVYKSIYGETVLPLSPHIHFLIGPNGAGKSTLLEALSFLGEYEIPQKWTPRFLTPAEQNELRKKAASTVILEVEFVASPELFGGASSIDAQEINTIFYSVFADGGYSITSNLGNLPVTNERYKEKYTKVVHALTSTLGEIREGAHGQTPQLMQTAANCIDSLSHAEPKNLNQYLQNLLRISAPYLESHATASLKQQIDEYNSVNELYNNPPDWVADLRNQIPCVTLIPPRYELPDTFSIAEVEAATKGQLLSAKKLLTLGGITPDSLKDLDPADVQHAMHQASERLTNLITKNWRQESLELKLSLKDDFLILSIRESTGAFISPSECSEGLKWFLPFYINLAVDLGDEWKNGIILVDDPGVYLHPQAQKDVRELLQKLAKDNTVVVSTHSPFILDPSETSNICVVSKLAGKRGKIKGTQVRSPKDSGWEDKAVIRAAIGMTIGDTLFGNKITLIVEGHSDRIYLESILRIPDIEKRLGVKFQEIGLINAMGADRIEFYANWCATENRKFCVILDNDSKGRGRFAKLKQMSLENFSLLVDKTYTRSGPVGDSTIEDVLALSEFDVLTSQSFGIGRKYTPDMVITALSKQSEELMNVTRASNALQEIEGKKINVDKILIASKFSNIIDPESESDEDLIKISDATIDRFRDLLKKAIEKSHSKSDS